MALWTPANLTTATSLWFDGDDCVFNGSNQLTSITLKGSKAAGAATVTGTISKSTLNSLNGIQLNASTKRLSRALGAWSSSSLYMFAVFKLNTGANGRDGGILTSGHGIVATGCLTFHTTSAAAGDGAWFAANGFSGAPQGMTGTVEPYSEGVGVLFGVQLGASNAAWTNGSSTSLTSSSTGSISLTANTWVIGHTFGGTGEYMDAELYQLVLLDYAPTTAEREKIEGWAAHKYGLTANLPGGHTYKTSAPTDGAYSLTADRGTFTLTGQAATLRVARKLAAAHRTFTLSGQNATLRRGYPLAGGQATFSLAGQAANLRIARKLVAAQGTFTLAGQAANLNRTGNGLTAEPATFALSGQSATLRVGRKLAAARGTFSLAGQAAALQRARNLVAATGTFALTGRDASFRRTYVLAATRALFTLSGQAAGLYYSADVILAPPLSSAATLAPSLSASVISAPGLSGTSVTAPPL
jgi:hypothetical protein